ncbi:MAG: N-acetylmuramoyl-L-alanine amidase [Anaerolineae bacterium]|nr:N-acetylmuramoyl-L-alanine amidase [Anaerolineae bacterium]
MAEGTATPGTVNSPYVGPKPFETDDRQVFFGRDWEAEQLTALVVAHPAVLLYAQSGAGKSSLLNAKVLLDLETAEGCEVLPVARVRGDLPPGVLANRITNMYIFNTLMSWSEITELRGTELVDMTLVDFLRQVPRQGDEDGYPVLRVLVFDQFEELFTFYPERWPERDQFFEQVNAALRADAYLRVLFVIREDYLAQIDTYADRVPEHLRSRFRLEQLGSEAALVAVDGPLQTTPRSFAPGVAAKLVSELLKIRAEGPYGRVIEQLGRYVEPVQLQVVCQGLWDALPPNVTVITDDNLETFGDVDQALTRFYERAVTDTIQRTERLPVLTEWRLRNWFEEELITPSGTRGLVYRGLRRTGTVPNEAVDILEGHRIIRGERRAGARWYELTHDRFIGPIQRANRAWRLNTLKYLARVAGSIITGIILFLIIIGPVYNVVQQFTQETRLQSVSATATIAIAEATAASRATQVYLNQMSQQIEAEAAAVQATSTALAQAIRKDRVRPVRSGLSVGAEGATAGTLGYFAVDDSGQVYIISAADVLGSTRDELILQPGPFDGGIKPDDVIGRVYTSTSAIQIPGPIASLTALGVLADGLDFDGSVNGVGPLLGIHAPQAGMSIRKLGRATGEKTGIITAIDRPVSVNFGTDQTVRLSGAALAEIEGSAGDAGALVFDAEGFAIGIFVMVGQQGIIVPMQAVLDLYGVRLLPPQVQIQDKSALLKHNSVLQYEMRDLADINSIIVHHTGTPPDISVERIAEFSVERRNLPGITYHYCVTAEGVVYQTQPLTIIPNQADSEALDNSINVCMIGDFSETLPPQAQLNATAVLIAQLAKAYNIPITQIYGRTEFPPPVASPGQWFIWRQTLLDRVSHLLAGGVPPPAVTPVPTPTLAATPDGGVSN